MGNPMSWLVWGVIILNILGYFLGSSWPDLSRGVGYFDYKVGLLRNIPYWLFATICFILGSGIAAFQNAMMGFHIAGRQGNYRGGLNLPFLRLFGINLLIIGSLLLLFILLRASGL